MRESPHFVDAECGTSSLDAMRPAEDRIEEFGIAR